MWPRASNFLAIRVGAGQQLSRSAHKCIQMNERPLPGGRPMPLNEALWVFGLLQAVSVYVRE